MDQELVIAVGRVEARLHLLRGGTSTPEELRGALRTLFVRLTRAADGLSPDGDGTDWAARVHATERGLRRADSPLGLRRAVLAAILELAPLFERARLEEACLL